MKKAVGIIRHLGPRWVVFRLWHAGRLRSGAMLRRDPIRPWSNRPGDAGFLAAAPRVLAGLADFEKLAVKFSAWDSAAAEPPVRESIELLAGRFRYFGWRTVELGRSPAWQSNPLTGESIPGGLHWSQLHADTSPERHRPSTPSGVVDDRVGRDPIQESAERFVPKPGSPNGLKCPLEARGGDVLGDVAIPDASNDVRVDPRQVPVVQLAEGSGIDPGAGHEGPLPGRVHASCGCT